jgi:hypothetical protein
MLEMYLDEDMKPVKAMIVTSFLIFLGALCFGYTIYMIMYMRKMFGSQEKLLLWTMNYLCLGSLSLVIE